MVSRALHETDILRAAAAFEAAQPWADRKPSVAPPQERLVGDRREQLRAGMH
jgi:hypothetical protein